MTKVAVAGVVGMAALLACGGGGSTTGHVCENTSTTPPELSSDFASSFTGTWSGTLSTVVDGGPAQEGPGRLEISRKGVNLLGLEGICAGAVPGLVQSATVFETACFDCPAVRAADCDRMALRAASGTATLSGDTLVVELHSTATGCGLEYAITQTLSGATRLSAARASATGTDAGPGEHLAAALERRLDATPDR